ncbi:MAG: HD domain-containing protein [Proteobacteria bacterium]|nr:HD domain-containing protein [Pseudomonadota bacterium]
MNDHPRQVSFSAMKDGTREDYLLLRELEEPFVKATVDRILKALAEQEDETMEGYKISRLAHGLQSATRAWRDGADIDWVVGALLHDIGDGLAPQNHDEYAATIIRPYMREEVVWTVQHHGAFQMLYYAHHYGWNQHEREKYRGEFYFDSCAGFCERWDQASFDPDYETLPLSFFVPLVRQVFARPPYKPETLQAGIKKPLYDPVVAKERAAA